MLCGERVIVDGGPPSGSGKRSQPFELYVLSCGDTSWETRRESSSATARRIHIQWSRIWIHSIHPFTCNLGPGDFLGNILKQLSDWELLTYSVNRHVNCNLSKRACVCALTCSETGAELQFIIIIIIVLAFRSDGAGKVHGNVLWLVAIIFPIIL